MYLASHLRPQGTRSLAAVSARRFGDGEIGLHFGLSDLQRQFQELARSFAREKIAPVAAELDRLFHYRYNPSFPFFFNPKEWDFSKRADQRST